MEDKGRGNSIICKCSKAVCTNQSTASEERSRHTLRFNVNDGGKQDAMEKKKEKKRYKNKYRRRNQLHCLSVCVIESERE